MQYKVVYEIEVEANNPLDAARQVHEIMLDRNSFPPIFDITGEDGKTERIDLFNFPAK